MVYILFGAGFEEAEALVTADILRRADIPVSLAGIGSRTVTGGHGISVETDLLVNAVQLAEGDMVVLPGGLGGVYSIEHSEPAMALAAEAAHNPKMRLSAICAAPTLLARAGLFPRGLHAVCYPGMEDQLLAAGVIPLMHLSVVRDGRFITGKGPGTAYDFALALVDAISGTDTAKSIQTDLCYRL